MRLGRGTCFGEFLVFLGLLPWVWLALERQDLQRGASLQQWSSHPFTALPLPPSCPPILVDGSPLSIHALSLPTTHPDIPHGVILLTSTPSNQQLLMRVNCMEPLAT